MKTIATALVLALGLGGAALAAPAAGPMTSVKAFVDGINKGDMKAAGAPFEADVSIIDELAPYAWRGKDAFGAWVADFGKDLAKSGATEPVMTLGRASRSDISGDRAYLVVPAVYTFKTKDGQAMREPGQFAFALHKAAGGWKIASWAWSGGKVKPAAAAAK